MIIRYEGLSVHPDQEDGVGFARAEVMEARLLVDTSFTSQCLG